MNNIFDVCHKTALITGASSGIGRHAALLLAEHGAHVIIIGRNQQRLHQVAEQCQNHGVQALPLVADVKDAAAITDMLEQAKQTFYKVDILINAAGIGNRLSSDQLTPEQWDEVFATNTKGTFLVGSRVAQWMQATQTAGSIINISSSAAFHVGSNRIAYSASKLSVESITRSMASEYVTDQIRVNCLAPGFFETPLTDNFLKSEQGQREISKVPMQRAAQLEELNGVLLLLASQASSYMTGSIINVDGGFAISRL